MYVAALALALLSVTAGFTWSTGSRIQVERSIELCGERLEAPAGTQFEFYHNYYSNPDPFWHLKPTPGNNATATEAVDLLPNSPVSDAIRAALATSSGGVESSDGEVRLDDCVVLVMYSPTGDLVAPRGEVWQVAVLEVR